MNKNEKSITHINFGVLLIFSTFYFFSFWGFYWYKYKIRPFDIFGLVTLVFFIIYALFYRIRNRDMMVLSKAYRFFHFFLLSFIFTAFGLITDIENYKSGIAFLTGVILFFITFNLNIDKKTLNKAVAFILTTHIAYYFIQYLYFNLTGVLIELHDIFGGETRALGAGMYRPTGFFQEPAHYCLAIFTLVALKINITGKIDVFSIFGIISMLISISLWGITASIMLLVIVSKTNLLKSIFLIIIFFLTVKLLPGFDENFVGQFITNRISNIDYDTSAYDRYASLFSIWEDLPVIDLLFGKGISTQYFTHGGGNGIAFILATGGIVGGIYFMFLLLSFSVKEKRFQVIFIIIICMTAASAWTYFYWWMWLGFMLKNYRLREDP